MYQDFDQQSYFLPWKLKKTYFYRDFWPCLSAMFWPAEEKLDYFVRNKWMKIEFSLF